MILTNLNIYKLSCLIVFYLFLIMSNMGVLLFLIVSIILFFRTKMSLNG